MNDIIEVTGHDHQTPRIRFVQKGKGLVSFTGEKLYEVQVIAAVDKALGGAAGPLPLHRRRGRAGGCHQPRLVFLIEFHDPIADHDGSALVDRLDEALGEENDDYLTKRKSLRHGPPIIRVVRPGEFDRYRRRMVETGQRADDQFKVLRLTSDTSFAAERDLTGSERTDA